MLMISEPLRIKSQTRPVKPLSRSSKGTEGHFRDLNRISDHDHPEDEYGRFMVTVYAALRRLAAAPAGADDNGELAAN
jgi:hypothetical protein